LINGGIREVSILERGAIWKCAAGKQIVPKALMGVAVEVFRGLLALILERQDSFDVIIYCFHKF
jgi:hypothetical protein